MSAQTLEIIYAVLMAIVYGLYSYFKATPQEQFNPYYALKTVIIGVLVGFAMNQFNMSYDQAFQFIITNGLLMIAVDKFINLLIEKFGGITIMYKDRQDIRLKT